MRATMKRLKLAIWLALLMAAPALARPDLIFKVPEVRHAAVPRRPAEASANTSTADELLQPTQYYMEHEISISDATKAAQILKLHQAPESRMGCGACSRWEREYCADGPGGGVLGDHCCCERRYMREPFPWLPHSCYLPAARCTLRAHNCAHYSRVRDCCCHQLLADKWKSILSKASRLSLSGAALLVLALLMFSLCV